MNQLTMFLRKKSIQFILNNYDTCALYPIDKYMYSSVKSKFIERINPFWKVFDLGEQV